MVKAVTSDTNRSMGTDYEAQKLVPSSSSASATPSFLNDRHTKFFFLVGGIMFFFGCHNYMQEFIMNLPGFKVGVLLGYLEVFGVAICSYIERAYYGETTRRAPWEAYFMLCLCLLISSATSNIALSYINYPTKVVFRSCKLIPTMLIALLYNRKRVHTFEFAFGILISLGMVLFAVADSQVYPKFDMIGIVLVCISVVADAFLPNFQERVFDAGSSRLEVTFFTNILCLAFMTVSFTITGDLPEAFAYVTANPHTLHWLVFYTFLAYIAITFHMALVKEFGGIVTVLVGNARKAVTIVMSFLLFPKPMSPLYLLGGVFVFGGLIANAYMKERTSSEGKKSSSSAPSM